MSNYKGKERNFFAADGVRIASRSPYFRGIPGIVPIPLPELFDLRPDPYDFLSERDAFLESRISVPD